MLAYFFPPNSSGGVPRTVHFVKYLDRLGWQSTVIAPAWPGAAADANVGFSAVVPPGAEVVRAGRGGDDDWVWKALRLIPRVWRVEQPLREAFQYPDRFVKWNRDALPLAREVLARRRHHVIYSTSPPVTSHYIALRLREEFGLPWVADFRDPWTDNVLEYGDPPSWRRRIDRRLQRRIFESADCIVANTEANRVVLVEKHGVPPDKVTTITNGYDEDDFRGVHGEPPAERFRITYCGSFYSTYNPSAFLAALKKFLTREPDARLVLTLAGDACRWAGDNIRDPDLSSSSRLELLGYLSHREVCAVLVSSHWLLHTYPAGISYSIPGKLFEYLRSGRPIIAVCDRPSEVASLLERTGHGRTFRPEETEALADYIEAEYGEWRAQGQAPSSLPLDERVRAYDRALLTRRLAQAFEGIAGDARVVV
jgi:glycosyltransferase involved in cell wall biosynthesis